MTPKEKSRELVDTFYKEVKFIDRAKQCALIAVDEMIKEHTFKNPLSWNIKQKKFWEEVKQEIEKI